jgi:hypothetical protein
MPTHELDDQSHGNMDTGPLLSWSPDSCEAAPLSLLSLEVSEPAMVEPLSAKIGAHQGQASLQNEESYSPRPAGCETIHRSNASIKRGHASPGARETKPKRARISEAAKTMLESQFQRIAYPRPEDYAMMVQATHLDIQTIKNWFQNHRRREAATGK